MKLLLWHWKWSRGKPTYPSQLDLRARHLPSSEEKWINFWIKTPGSFKNIAFVYLQAYCCNKLWSNLKHRFFHRQGFQLECGGRCNAHGSKFEEQWCRLGCLRWSCTHGGSQFFPIDVRKQPTQRLYSGTSSRSGQEDFRWEKTNVLADVFKNMYENDWKNIFTALY